MSSSTPTMASGTAHRRIGEAFPFALLLVVFAPGADGEAVVEMFAESIGAAGAASASIVFGAAGTGPTFAGVVGFVFVTVAPRTGR